MKKLISLFAITLCITPLISAEAAVQVKKATPVATQASSNTDATASLVPTVIGLVSGVMDMNTKQNALSANCIPSAAEINFVNNTMKEWAKTGQVTAKSVQAVLKREPCATANGYEVDVKAIGAAAGMEPCYNNFMDTGNKGMVWERFPMAGKGTYCKSGAFSCSGNDLITLSDAYDMFNLIDFGPADYTASEATMAARLLNKVEDCSSSRINAKKKEMWGEFLVGTASSLGQKTNTGGIMEQVGAISSGGSAGAMGSIGSVAAQFMNK